MARTEKYLPTGSKLVLRRANSPATWYTTVKEIVLAQAPVAATCPITNTAVVTTTHQGIDIWFQPRMVRSRIVLEEGDVDEATFNEQFSLFHYDVPQAGGYANPSSRLYPIAVRLTESAWMMRTSDIPYALMAEMQDNGCSVEVNKFDKTESRRLIHQAVAKLQQELADAVERAERSRDRAYEALEAATQGEDAISPEEAEKAHLRQAKAIEKRLTELAANVTKAAQRFGINERAVNIGRLAHTATLVGRDMRERAQAYAAAQRALAATPGATAQALAQGMANDAVPFYAAADALAEAGDEATAAALQTAFDEGDETFSLADAGSDE